MDQYIKDALKLFSELSEEELLEINLFILEMLAKQHRRRLTRWREDNT